MSSPLAQSPVRRACGARVRATRSLAALAAALLLACAAPATRVAPPRIAARHAPAATPRTARPQPPTPASGARLAVGFTHACLLRPDGTVVCWGSNTAGVSAPDARRAPATPTDAGGSLELPHVPPTRVGGITDAIDIAAGAEHTCALLRDGTVRCWGGNTFGQLGDGTVETRHEIVTVREVRDAVSIAASYRHTCAVLRDGTVRCWGYNEVGALGRGGGSREHGPVAVEGLSNVLRVALGLRTSCALLADASVRCWGATGTAEGCQAGPAPREPSATLRGATLLAVRGIAPCVVERDGAVRCTECESTPTDLSALAGASSLALDGGTDCGVVRGRVLCRGNNGAGQLGLGDDDPVAHRGAFSAVPWLTDAVQVATGLGTVCALDARGAVSCWGSNGFGVLGTPPSGPVQTPVEVAAARGAVDLAAGAAHSCSLGGDGRVSCWGANGHGQLGDGTRRSRAEPAPARAPDGVVQTRCGADYCCARMRDGAVRCWGGIDGRGEAPADVLAPDAAEATIAGLAPSAEIAVGTHEACSRDARGVVACWAARGAPTDPIAPPAPPVRAGLPPATRVVAGHDTFCAIDRAGVVRCWGWDPQRLLGPEPVDGPRRAPVALRGFGPRARDVCMTTDAVCVLGSDGGVRCRGPVTGDPLPVRTPLLTPRRTPVAVEGLGGPVDALACSGATSCAIGRDGHVACWSTGLVGIAGRTITASAVAGLPPAAQVAPGWHHACARAREGGAVHCWGEGADGQLARPISSHVNSPVRIAMP